MIPSIPSMPNETIYTIFTFHYKTALILKSRPENSLVEHFFYLKVPTYTGLFQTKKLVLGIQSNGLPGLSTFSKLSGC